MILSLGKNDPKVTEFREKVYTEDLNLPIQCMDSVSYTHLTLPTNREV